MNVRLRALVFLLVLTAGDYLLWDWSIAGGHDIVSLVAGLTLLPLAAISLGQLALAAGRLLRALLGAAHMPARSRRAAGEEDALEGTSRPSAPQADSSSGRLAA
jgi:hypothetical protein